MSAAQILVLRVVFLLALMSFAALMLQIGWAGSIGAVLAICVASSIDTNLAQMQREAR